MQKHKKNIKKVGIYLFLIIVALIFIMPMAFTLLSSVKTTVEIFSKPFDLPEQIKWSNYSTAWKDANMGLYFGNSLIQAVTSVVLIGLVSSLAAYILSRFDFKFRGLITGFFMLGMMIPMHTVLVPVAYMIGFFQLKNQVWALILIYTAFNMPLSIMILSNYMRGINNSLEEAALIDGAGYFQIYKNIMLPLSVPAISTVSIFNFLHTWNNIIFPLLFINTDKRKPISLGLLNFKGEAGNDYGPLMAAIVITIAVPLVIYILFQEKVENGLSAGAVKE